MEVGLCKWGRFADFTLFFFNIPMEMNQFDLQGGGGGGFA